MAKVGILLPRESMRQEALKLLEDIHLDVVYCRTIETPDTINEARRAVEMGAQLIIARGFQAKILREQTKIPLVEIQFTAQEVGLLLQQAKEIVGKPHPHIAIIAFENMLPDMTYIASLMEVELTVSYLEKVELTNGIFSEYEKNRPDIIIGGQMTCEAARTRGYLTLFYQSTTESIATALRIASRISFAMDSEQMHAALFETVLDSTFHAILQINTDRTLTSLNYTAQEMLGKKEQEMIGRPIEDIIPEIDSQSLEQVLSGSRESMAVSVELNKEAFMVLIASIRFDDCVTGAILSFRQLSAMSSLSRQAKRELLLSGYRTHVTFRDLTTRDPRMQDVLDKAKVFALSNSPILLYEAEGSESSMIARAIHNNSNRKAGPFVSLDVRDLYPEEQVDALLRRSGTAVDDPRLQDKRNPRGSEQKKNAGFHRISGSQSSTRESSYTSGDPEEIPPALPTGAMIRANHGTLFINRIEKLTLQAQHQLLRTLLPWTQIHTDARPIDSLNVRIIACAKQNLLPAVEADKFSEELYYHFSGLTLTIPALETRPEDLKALFRSYVSKFAKEYNRHLQLTEEAVSRVSKLRWPGGASQVSAFSERLVLTSSRRRIDEKIVLELFSTLYPEVREVQGEQHLVVYDTPQAQRIRELLKKYRGDREAVAAELGISKTTLWRHMKKYNVTAVF